MIDLNFIIDEVIQDCELTPDQQKFLTSFFEDTTQQFTFSYACRTNNIPYRVYKGWLNGAHFKTYIDIGLEIAIERAELGITRRAFHEQADAGSFEAQKLILDRLSKKFRPKQELHASDELITKITIETIGASAQPTS